MRGAFDALACGAAGIAALSACACSSNDRAAIALDFVQDETLNSAAQVRASLQRIELRLDAEGGFGVGSTGTYGPWQALNTDTDAALELVTKLALPPNGSAFPPFRLLEGAIGARSFALTARGHDAVGRVIAAGATVPAEFDPARSRSIAVPLDLLGPHRAPRVVSTQPNDGAQLSRVPDQITVEFSREIDPATTDGQLALVSAGESASAASAGSWAISVQRVSVFGVEVKRSIARLSLAGPCELTGGERYRIEVGTGIRAGLGTPFDQDAKAPLAQGYAATFSVAQDAAGANPSCTTRSCLSADDCRFDGDPRTFVCVDADPAQGVFGRCFGRPDDCTLPQAVCPPGELCGSRGTCEARHCSNGTRDGDESDADCGGSCDPCARGKRCTASQDCTAPDVCANNVCGLAPSCSNSTQDGDETDVDCGGSCNPCARGKRCTASQDCTAPDVCTNNVCGLAPSCSNRTRDGDESDVDCGGSCDPCARGKRCTVSQDCIAPDVCIDSSSCGQPTSCAQLLAAHEETTSRFYWVKPSATASLRVYCDMQTDGGGWTLVLLNSPYPVTPKPGWSQATAGNTISGTMATDLKQFDQLVGLQFWEAMGDTLRVEVGQDPANIVHRAEYRFSIEAGVFSLHLSNPKILIGGTAPDLYLQHNGVPFSTLDRDNDQLAAYSCAALNGRTAWWYRSCWAGSLWGPGDTAIEGVPVGAHWVGRSQSFPWGAIWVR